MDSGDGDDSSNPEVSMPATSFRRLLPASTSPRVISATEQPSRRLRQAVTAACLECRKRKVKCTGTRPTCFRCSAQELDCEWDTEPETTRRQAILNRIEELERENDDLNQLIRYLCLRPEAEAFEIFKRLRETGDALRVLDLVRVGDLLLGHHPDGTRGSGHSDGTRKPGTASSKSGSSRYDPSENDNEPRG